MTVKKYVSQQFRISQDRIDKFSQASGGIGKIHTDPEYAKKTKFKGTLVHGYFLLALIEKELIGWFPEWEAKGTLEARFVKPIRSGEAFFITCERDETTNEFKICVLCDEEEAVIGTIVI